MRSAYLSLSELKENIQEFVETLQHLNEQYEELVEFPPEDKKNEPLDEVWEDKYQPSYRKTTDYLYVATHVCKDIHNNSEKCDIPANLWQNKCDGRGEGFLDEFQQEIDKAIEGIVAKVKEAIANRDTRRASDL